MRKAFERCVSVLKTHLSNAFVFIFIFSRTSSHVFKKEKLIAGEHDTRVPLASVVNVQEKKQTHWELHF